MSRKPSIPWATVQPAAQRRAAEVARAEEGLAREAQAYLASTDWMVLRSIETGKAVPSDVAKARAAARARAEGGK
jgi:hypothetical protein